MDQVLQATQASDPYDGVLPLLEARVERTRAQETESEAMKALETITETAAPATPIAVDYSRLGRSSQTGLSIPRHCKDCATGLIRIIRDSDDTVRHVNGEKCKRFHQ